MAQEKDDQNNTTQVPVFACETLEYALHDEISIVSQATQFN